MSKRPDVIRELQNVLSDSAAMNIRLKTLLEQAQPLLECYENITPTNSKAVKDCRQAITEALDDPGADCGELTLLLNAARRILESNHILDITADASGDGPALIAVLRRVLDRIGKLEKGVHNGT